MVRDFNYADPEKMVDKFNPDTFDPVRDKKNTASEQLFIDTYLDCGNATASYLKAFPEESKTKTPVQCRAMASYYLRKFMLKGKNHKKVRLKNAEFYDNTKPEMVSYIKQQYELGALSEEELFKRMNDLSLRSTADATKFTATREMRQWVREAKSEIEANKLSELEIIPLMVDALSDLPHEKYVAVLKGVREKRNALNKEKSIMYDPDAIREEQRQKMVKQGRN